MCSYLDTASLGDISEPLWVPFKLSLGAKSTPSFNTPNEIQKVLTLAENFYLAAA